MIINYIKKFKISILVIVVLLSLNINVQSQNYYDDENLALKDQVILSNGSIMYIGDDVKVTINADFKIIENSSNKNVAKQSDSKIHLSDHSTINVIGDVIFDTRVNSKNIFNMGQDAYLIMASNNEPQAIIARNTFNTDAIVIPHLAIDGKGNKLLKANIETNRLDVKNSKLDLLTSSLTITKSEEGSSDTSNPILGDKGFISNTLNDGSNSIDDKDRGKLIVDMSKDILYKIPLGINNTEFNESPRIISLSSTEDVVFGFQMLPNAPVLISEESVSGVNEYYYYKLFNLSNNKSADLNLEIAYDRLKEGDFSDLVYYKNEKKWVNFNDAFNYGNLKVKNSIGSLKSDSSLISQFRSINITNLSLNPKQSDNLFVDTAGNNVPISFTLQKGLSAQFHIPNIFTPNGDGINDTFEITGLHNKSSTGTAKLEIYESIRGNSVLIYKNDNYSGGWNGGNLPAGVYFYSIKFVDKDGKAQDYKGDVTIKR